MFAHGWEEFVQLTIVRLLFALENQHNQHKTRDSSGFERFCRLWS